MSFNLDNYEPVAVRLARWLDQHPDGRVITHLVHYTEGRSCVFRAELYTGDILTATGWAEEHVEDRGVNRTSHLENAESSAIGRALANAGLSGSDPTKRPSREEMQKVARMAPEGSGRPQEPRNSGGPGRATAGQLTLIRTMALERDYQLDVTDELTFSEAQELITMLKSIKRPKKDATPTPTVMSDEEPF